MKDQKTHFPLLIALVEGIAGAVLCSVFILKNNSLSFFSILLFSVNFLLCFLVFFCVSFIFHSYILYRSHKVESRNKETLLKPTEFKCFHCNAIIEKAEKKCTQCGRACDTQENDEL